MVNYLTMRFTLFFALVGFIISARAQVRPLQTTWDREVFYSQTFGWGNSHDPKGWTAPPGYYFLDPKDIGYNWVWWPPDSGFYQVYTQEPPLNSTTRDNGYLALFLEAYNSQTGTLITENVDNSVVFPIMDCSRYSSVIVSFKTQFMVYVTAQMFLEITADDWKHIATYDVSFGCKDKDRPLDNPPGVPAVFEGNISNMAAGMPRVQMRLHWKGTFCYFWVIDDFSLRESYDDDLKIGFVQVEWDDNDPETAMAWIHDMPKSQLDGHGGFCNFKSSVENFGSSGQENAYLDIDITKNWNRVFHTKSAEIFLQSAVTDTFNIADKYSPVDYGHYKIAFDLKSSVPDDNPGNNKSDVFFNVTDSVYSRSDNTNELGWSVTRRYYFPDDPVNFGHFVGSIFPIFNDCEASSVSAFITGGKADEFIEYRFVLFSAKNGYILDTPFELLATDMIPLDSSQFNKWITMPLQRDGESEFLKKGDVIYAGVQFDNLNADFMDRRNKGLAIGSDNSVRLTEPTTVACLNGDWQYSDDYFISKRNLMIRLNLNDHNNIYDNIDLNQTRTTLGQNFPNPFSQSTEIPYELAASSEVTLIIADYTGRTVRIVNEGVQPAGKHTVRLETGSLGAGFYLYTLKAGSLVQSRQMIVLN